MDVLWKATPKERRSIPWEMYVSMVIMQFVFVLLLLPLIATRFGKLDNVLWILLCLLPSFMLTPLRLKLQCRWTSFILTREALVEEIKIWKCVVHRRIFYLNKGRRPFLRITSPCVYRDGAYFGVTLGHISQYETSLFLKHFSSRRSLCPSTGIGIYAMLYGLTFNDTVRLLAFFSQYAFHYDADCTDVEQAVKLSAINTINFEDSEKCCIL